jgi:Lrp/AsnC family transcriptional regulator, leucine-responsive regulatory protein
MYNNKDLKILVQLRKNSRAQLTDISKSTGIPISTIYDRLKNKDSNLISSNVSLINFDMLGFNTRAKICVKCPKNSKREVLEFLMKSPWINSLYKINNGYDYMIEVVCRNVKEIEEFIEILDEKYSIKSRQIFYIIEDIIREKFFSDELYMELLRPQNIKRFI